MRKIENSPRKRLPEFDDMITQIAKDLLKRAGMNTNVPLYTVNQRRGKFNRKANYIAIPLHAIKSNRPGYLIYYVSHELAHVFTSPNSTPHGGEFMANLKRLCPIEFQIYEYGYKPRNANRANVAKNKPVNKKYFPPKLYEFPAILSVGGE